MKNLFLICAYLQVEIFFYIQINNLGKELVNDVSHVLHLMTGAEQRVTSAYHPQSSALLECQNHKIKNAMIMILDQKPGQSRFIIEVILFAHRLNCLWSSKYSHILFYVQATTSFTCRLEIFVDWTLSLKVHLTLSIKTYLKLCCCQQTW